ncbi:MAG: hypothetical protein K0U10_01915 [Gammaproteobacteria bacterium]|nr:hypothetical protein [Gammaproteobacteria bacterium]
MAIKIVDAVHISSDFYDSLHDDRNQEKVFYASEEGWGNPTIDRHSFPEVDKIFYKDGGETKVYSDTGYGMFSYTSDASMKLLTKLNDVKDELDLDNGGVTLSTLEQKMGTEDFNLLLSKDAP